MLASGALVAPAHAEQAAPQRLLMCADHYPPYTLYDTPAGPPRGSVVDIVQSIANSMHLSLTFTPNIPFKRCLNMLKNGEVDIMGGLLFSEARAKDIHLFPYLITSKKSFYAPMDAPINVESFSDLEGMKIGTTLGYQYFPEFDREERLFSKTNAAHVNDNFRRLLAGRIDLVIATERQALFLLSDNPDYWGKFKVMPYSYSEDNRVYIGLSKATYQGARVGEMATVIASLLSTHAFEEISQKFYQVYFEKTPPSRDESPQ